MHLQGGRLTGCKGWGIGDRATDAFLPTVILVGIIGRFCAMAKSG